MSLATTLLLACALAPLNTGDALSFSEGRALSAEKDAVLLVLVHGSDWHPFGERLFEDVWRDAKFSRATELVLADVDVLQAPSDDAKKVNDERNAGWKKKESALRTYPAVIAYGPDGARIGDRQGRELPKELGAARLALLEFAECCRLWSDLGADLAAARTAGDTARELELLIERDRLPLQRVTNLIDEVKRLDPEDEAGHLARLSFPYCNALVKQATDEAKAGKGAEAEARLKEMLANPAYTDEQRGVIHLALGGAYRRWEGHEDRAADQFEAAWRTAPDSICGRAGMRLFLRDHAAPSLAFGWVNRHTAVGATTWKIADFPTTLEPGTYRLRLERTKGAELNLAGVRLLAAGEPRYVDSAARRLTKDEPAHDFEITLSERLEDVTLSVSLGRAAKSRGTITWTAR